MQILRVLLSIVAISLFAGCSSVPMAPLDQDAKAKSFSPSPSKASLYIYRNESLGAAVPMTVTVNGKSLGQTSALTYFQVNLAPGKYNLESHAENVSSLLLTTEAGKTYFVWQEVKMGVWMARSMLQQTDEKKGRAGVMESKLIATSLVEDQLTPLDVPRAAADESVSAKLRELQTLRKDGVISEDEFQKKKEQLLQRL